MARCVFPLANLCRTSAAKVSHAQGFAVASPAETPSADGQLPCGQSPPTKNIDKHKICTYYKIAINNQLVLDIVHWNIHT